MSSSIWTIPVLGSRVKSQSVKQSMITLVIANIILLMPLTMFLVIFVEWQENNDISVCEGKKNAEEHDAIKEMRYCFQLKEEACIDRGYHVKKSTNQTLCCGSLGNHVYDLILEQLPQQMETDAAKASRLNKIKRYMAQVYNDPTTVLMRPAAHLGILADGNLTGPDQTAPRVHWEEPSQRSFLSGGLLHRGDRVTVTKAGYYFVYTGLQFSINSSAEQSEAIVAYLYRHVNGTYESQRKLMTSRESSCTMTREGLTGPVTLYMAGTFLLREKDEISVRTASQSLLNRNPATTYMGMHMV